LRTAPAPIALLACLLARGALLAQPTPTPTPRAKLSGGFGRTPIAGPANGGQTMADVVRAAGEARARKAQKKPLAITNRNLVTDPTKGRLSTAAAAPGVPTGAPRGTPAPRITPPAAAGTPTERTPEAGVATEESRWRERARAARQRVEDARSRIAQLESETRKLEADFYSWDDGQYRDGVIKPAWDRKREELETARRELSDAEKDLADLP
jgi:hypothetical protein